MAQYIINNQKLINSNSRNNYARGDENLFVWSSSQYQKYYLTLRRISYKYQNKLTRDDRGFDNFDTSNDTIQRFKRINSDNDIDFGYDNNEYVLTFPPYYKKYPVF